MANFVNTNAANNAPADFTATINWGDGTTTAGVVANPGGTNIYTVNGTHTYADEGTFTVTVTLSDDAPGTATATATNTVTVAEGDGLSGSATPISTTEGTAFSGTVATFTDTDTSNTAADFTATIAWGDGTTTAGPGTGGSGSFTVSGSHTYTASGSFAVAVTLSDDAPGTASVTATATASVSGDVVVVGTNGNDTLTLSETPGGGVGSITYVLNGGPSVTLTGVQSFTFDGLGGNDTLVMDSSHGTPLISGGVFYDGGTGVNALTLNANGKVVRTVQGAITLADPVTMQNTNTQTTNINSAAAVNAIPGPDTIDRGTAFTGLNAQERFVQVLYLDDLGRPGMKAELDGWVMVLNASGSQAVASGVELSPEAPPPGPELVRQLPGPADASRRGAGLGESAFAGADGGTGAQRHPGQPGDLQSGATITGDGGPASNTEYVKALYLVLLNRSASDAEIASWLNALPMIGRQDVGAGVPDGVGVPRDDFEGYYNALLHRPDDPAGLNGWVFSNLDVGAARVGFEASPEFFVVG